MSDCRFGVSPVNYPDPDPDPYTIKIYTLDKLSNMSLIRTQKFNRKVQGVRQPQAEVHL